MKKIMLVCAAGMSTSLLVSKMQEAAEDKDMKTDIFSTPASEAESILDDKEISVVLLAPQVRYLKNKYEKILAPKGIPFDVIDMTDYGMMNGQNVLELALKLMED